MAFTSNPVDGTRIHFEVEGDGPPLFLHCGFLGELSVWYGVGVVDALRDSFTLILNDPRGQGASGKPHDIESYAFERFVGDIEAILDSLDVQKTHFLGYSMGAEVGFAASVMAPHRFNSMILGGSHPFTDPVATVICDTVQEEAALLSQGMEAYVNELEARYGAVDPAVRERWLGNDHLALSASIQAWDQRPDLRQQLRESSVPALVYCGTADATFEPTREACQLMPRAHFVPLEGLDHLQAFLRFEQILPNVLSFLRQREPVI